MFLNSNNNMKKYISDILFFSGLFVIANVFLFYCAIGRQNIVNAHVGYYWEDTHSSNRIHKIEYLQKVQKNNKTIEKE